MRSFSSFSFCNLLYVWFFSTISIFVSPFIPFELHSFLACFIFSHFVSFLIILEFSFFHCLMVTTLLQSLNVFSNFKALLVCFLQCSNEFSLVCEYKITMIYINMFKFFLHICQCQTLPSFQFCSMLSKCLFAPMCEGYYFFYVLLRNHNLFFSICAIIKTWFSYLVPIHYYLFFVSFFIFSCFFFAKVYYL